ncbi:uncharacterized protein PAC_04866 [Phialocephala subalpina]|uniref:Uncharacterized protein n=1 Tax=Phialocephala subalpina TaxID=576137 RepID=A0A1L7WQE8_9HELO|nr:uncharacterized protein PAC_04866 [Phialocephala subalpina]
MKFSLAVVATMMLSVPAMPHRALQAVPDRSTGPAPQTAPTTVPGGSAIDQLVSTFQSPEQVAAKATDKRSKTCGGSSAPPDTAQSSGLRDSSLLPPGNPNGAD